MVRSLAALVTDVSRSAKNPVSTEYKRLKETPSGGFLCLQFQFIGE